MTLLIIVWGSGFGEITLLVIVRGRSLSVVALLIQIPVIEASLDCHGSCLLFSLAFILQWRPQHEVPRASWVVTPSKLLEILTHPYTYSKNLQESAVAWRLQLLHQGCWDLVLVAKISRIFYHLSELSKQLQLFAVSDDWFELKHKIPCDLALFAIFNHLGQLELSASHLRYPFQNLSQLRMTNT